MTESRSIRPVGQTRPVSVVARLKSLGNRVRRAVASEESGSAVIEFVMLGVVLLVPLVYLILAAGQIQAASYAAVGAADHAAHAFANAPDESSGAARARDAATRASQNMGISPGATEFEYSCAPGCMQHDGTVTVVVTVSIELPLMPPGVDAAVGSVNADSTRLFGGL
ncbi:hypothetical protein [Zhihengliuella halotolerans]|uniref:TadE-like protein n=1 Tax=Zhihengliuella halotolerans TaxID=370736 RepID=A0A4Q8ADU2_9MICC|nr:hypothetical protein [Zhihengliuella halotolerans]RZU61719.1 hypothetical protein EV380_1297 [Zhihengliuella halotolerans]